MRANTRIELFFKSMQELESRCALLRGTDCRSVNIVNKNKGELCDLLAAAATACMGMHTYMQGVTTRMCTHAHAHARVYVRTRAWKCTAHGHADVC